MIEVRPLTAQDVEAYRGVRLAVLRSDPPAFVTTAAEFAARDLAGIAAQISPTENAVTFGAFLTGELVGILTLARETRPSIRHRAGIYGVGVLKKARGQQVGDALMQAAIVQAQHAGVVRGGREQGQAGEGAAHSVEQVKAIS